MSSEHEKGYAGQLAWLDGKSLAEARQSLEARLATLAPSPYNDAGTRATRDYIRALERLADAGWVPAAPARASGRPPRLFAMIPAGHAAAQAVLAALRTHLGDTAPEEVPEAGR